MIKKISIIAVSLALLAGCGPDPAKGQWVRPSEGAEASFVPGARTVAVGETGSGFEASWVRLPGGAEEVLCVQTVGSNGSGLSCDWDRKRPAAQR